MILTKEESAMKSLKVEQRQKTFNDSWVQNHESSNLREIIAASGISERLWRLYAYFWLICLVFPIFSLIQVPRQGTSLLFPVLGLILFTATYFWVMWPHPLNDRARTRLGWHTSIAIITGLSLL